MKNGSTLLLKIVVSLSGIAVFALCVFLVRSLIYEDLGGYRPIVMGMLVAAIPFFVGLNEVLRLLKYIDQKKAFSKLSITSLEKIKYCGIIIGTLYGVGMPYIFVVADRDDAPGVVLLGLIFTFAPIGVAVFAGVFQKLLRNAINLKSENDLTI